MTDDEKAEAIKTVLGILEEDFANGNCGKHSTLALGCIGCQAAMVKAWHEDTSDLCYGTEYIWPKER